MIEDLKRNEAFDKLFRMITHGRLDAAVKMAEVIEEEFTKLEDRIAKLEKAKSKKKDE